MVITAEQTDIFGGHVAQFCLGAFLARMEAKIAFQVLLERTKAIDLAVGRDELKIAPMPGWYRHVGVPVKLHAA